METFLRLQAKPRFPSPLYFHRVSGSWTDHRNYRITFSFGEEDFLLASHDYQLHFAFDSKIGPHNGIGLAPELAEPDLQTLLEQLANFAAERPKLIYASPVKFNDRIPCGWSIELSFNCCTLELGDLGNEQIVIAHPGNWLFGSPKANLRFLFGISTAGQPPGTPPDLQYLANYGITSDFIQTHGLSELFEELVQNKLNEAGPNYLPAEPCPQKLPNAEPCPQQLPTAPASPQPVPINYPEQQPPSNNTSSKECGICFESTDRPFALVPCGHHPLCKTCAQLLVTCHVCRQHIQFKLPLFDTNS